MGHEVGPGQHGLGALPSSCRCCGAPRSAAVHEGRSGWAAALVCRLPHHHEQSQQHSGRGRIRCASFGTPLPPFSSEAGFAAHALQRNTSRARRVAGQRRYRFRSSLPAAAATMPPSGTAETAECSLRCPAFVCVAGGRMGREFIDTGELAADVPDLLRKHQHFCLVAVQRPPSSWSICRQACCALPACRLSDARWPGQRPHRSAVGEGHRCAS